MKRDMQDRTVVITGASSGIGRATALAFARRGARLALGARGEATLEDVAGACQRLGGAAAAIPTDVTDAEAVERLAAEAEEQFGHLDVWVNNAAVSLFARFGEAPLADERRVLETNLFGTLHGAWAAMRRFRARKRGLLVNVSSIVADLPQPYTSAYVMSKHAIRALSMSLRQELLLDGLSDVHACTVLPAAIDTPIFQHAANYTGRAVKAMPPVVAPERVADAIVDLVRRPQREVFVGNAARALSLVSNLAPGLVEQLMARQVDRQHLSDRPAPHTDGNLFAPMEQSDAVHGGWARLTGEQVPAAGEW